MMQSEDKVKWNNMEKKNGAPLIPHWLQQHTLSLSLSHKSLFLADLIKTV